MRPFLLSDERVNAQEKPQGRPEEVRGVVKNLLNTKPVKRENVKVKNPKNREKLIPPQK
jgi:hypothetical protein